MRKRDVYELVALDAVLRRVLEKLRTKPDDEHAELELRQVLSQMSRLLG